MIKHMAKKLKIQIFPDGRVQADVSGVKGKKCTDFIKVLEEILNAETINSTYTTEYYQTQNISVEEHEAEQLRNRQSD